MASKARCPDFLGIGSTRAGSSWLHYVLTAHPDIWISPVKELHYYDRPMNGKRTILKDPIRCKWRMTSYLKGKYDFNNDGFLNCIAWDFKYCLKKRSEKWYKELFSKAGKRAAGEVTPAYAILDESTIAQIAANNSELRAVYLLRHPIERGWSTIVNNLAKKRKRSINMASEQDMLSKIDEPGFLARSNYANNIRKWRSVIGED
ncbi:MAG: sulfotransferase, partial [Bacteroidales bacterium]